MRSHSIMALRHAGLLALLVLLAAGVCTFGATDTPEDLAELDALNFGTHSGHGERDAPDQ